MEWVNDVVFTLLGIRLPLKAFYGGRAKQLAALEMETLKVIGLSLPF